MRKNHFILVLMILIIGMLFGKGRECIFLSISPSAVNAGMGDNGVADVWHQNAFSAWSNPALTSFHEGVSFSYLDDKHYEKIKPVMKFSAAYMNIALKGIGINFPLPNSENYYGTSLEYGKSEVYNENYQIVAIADNYEFAKNYSFALNTDLVKSIAPDYLKLGIGLTYSGITSKLGIDDSSKVETDCINFGLAAKIDLSSFIESQNVRMEASLGYCKNNINHNTYERLDENYGESYIMDSDNFAIGIRYHQTLDYFVTNEHLIKIIKNTWSGQLTSGISTLEDYHAVSFGTEVGFFDTVFLRFGNYHDAKGQISGLTYGYGLKLNALDYGFIEYNYAKYPGGEIQNTQMKWDISAGINLQLF